LKHLLDRQPVLLPYDCDKNHAPCMKNGHSAHWAVLIGFLTVFSGEDGTKIDTIEGKVDENLRNLVWMNEKTELDAKMPATSSKRTFFIALHGKSTHPSLWEAETLLESNSQLNEIGENRTELDFVIPGCNLDDLRCRFVTLATKDAETI